VIEVPGNKVAYSFLAAPGDDNSADLWGVGITVAADLGPKEKEALLQRKVQCPCGRVSNPSPQLSCPTPSALCCASPVFDPMHPLALPVWASPKPVSLVHWCVACGVRVQVSMVSHCLWRSCAGEHGVPLRAATHHHMDPGHGR
jgi:hypothetical protein